MDVDAFAAAVVADHTRLTRAVYLLCGDRSLAEDCAQEAVARAWQRVQGGDDLRSLEAWTTTVALNECRTRLRRRGAEDRALTRVAARPAPAGAADPSTPDVSDVVLAAVLALPERQREVVVLHYFCDLDLATIAAVGGISTGAVKNALHHARAALARALSIDPEASP